VIRDWTTRNHDSRIANHEFFKAVLRFLLRRFALTIPVLLGVATLVFPLIHLIPGDPAQAMLGETASQQDVDELRRRLGLDRPLVEQYTTFLGSLLRGDLGTSLRTSQPVTTMIVERMPATFELAAAAMSFAIIVAMPLGIVAALSFLGLGVQPPTPSWGTMLNGGRSHLLDAPHLTAFPELAIALLVLGFNFLGDGLRRAGPGHQSRTNVSPQTSREFKPRSTRRTRRFGCFLRDTNALDFVFLTNTASAFSVTRDAGS
jgi:hypothetical protein